MAARCHARCGERRAIIREGVMFFLCDYLCNAQPVLIDNWLESVLGVALAQCLITAGLKKFKDKGKQGVMKEITQMHDMSVFKPIPKNGSARKSEQRH